ncbi:lysophospholipid acyltransferase family protein [bacterium]|nr:lysophospholipid acyltransferase family protein [bacterium]
MSSSARYRLEYWVARAFAALIRLLPLRVGWLVGAALGQLVFSVLRIRRQVTLNNLRHAFSGSHDKREIVKIGARCYRNLGRGLVEFCRFPMLNRENLGQMLEIEGLEHCHHALVRGKGIIILSAHFGSWEFLGPAFTLNGFPVDMFARTQRNPLADELLSRQRRGLGAEIIRTSRTPRGVVRSLRHNRLVVILTDQDGGRDGVFVPFMGRLASTSRGAARFAMETGAAILICFVIRQPRGPNRLVIDPPMEIPRTGDREADLLAILQIYTRRLESYVKTYPDQWFWPHRRWKTRPPSETLSSTG